MEPALTTTEIIDNGAAVRTLWSDGEALRFHNIWLRDNAQNAETRDPVSGQRLLTVTDIPTDSITAACVDGQDLVCTLADSTVLRFEADWLRAHAYDRRSHDEGIVLWDGDAAMPEAADFNTLCHDTTALRDWLCSFRTLGVARITGGPVEAGSVLKVVDLFGYVRETNYGCLFDVRPRVDAINLAYTGLGLEVHTDNPYRDPVPTLQLLYCLENTVEGGETVLVDGFYAASQLRKHESRHFELLSSYCARFEYAGQNGVRLQARKPMIQCAPDGTLEAVRFNNRSCAPLVDIPFEDMAAYYQAYRAFAQRLSAPEAAFRFRLEPGACFMVDNTRVLHGRTAYGGAGSRWLQGCYGERDSLLSKLAVLEAELA